MKIDWEKVRIWILIIMASILVLFGLFYLVMHIFALIKYGGLPVSEIPSFALYFMRGGK